MVHCQKWIGNKWIKLNGAPLPYEEEHFEGKFVKLIGVEHACKQTVQSSSQSAALYSNFTTISKVPIDYKQII